LILIEKPFQKWGLDFIGPIKLQAKCQATDTFWWPLTMQQSGWKHQHYYNNRQVFVRTYFYDVRQQL
jgi:hypothetical protein